MWATESVWIRWQREKFPSLPLSESSLYRPARRLVTILAELPLIPYINFTGNTYKHTYTSYLYKWFCQLLIEYEEAYDLIRCKY
jgi:hypothetical protein